MASDDKSLSVPGYANGKLPYIEYNVNNFFRRSTILYGASGTGKSTIIYWLMKMFEKIIPNWIVICPTNRQHNSYDGRVPPRCIIENPTVEKLREILSRQNASVETYNKANRINILEKLAMRANDTTYNNAANKIKDIAKKLIAQLQHRNDIPLVDKLSQEEQIKQTQESQLNKAYKAVIRKYRSVLVRYQLTKDEEFSLKYLDFNPALCIILDDCAAQIAAWGKDEVTKELFMLGRWKWVTFIISLQDDKLLPSDARKGSFNTIFTDPMCAIGFFENTKTNGIGKQMRKDADKVIEAVFRPLPSGARNNKKFVYNREDFMHKFRYMVAEVYPKFKVGSQHLWTLSEKMPAPDQSKLDKDNKYAQTFSIE